MSFSESQQVDSIEEVTSDITDLAIVDKQTDIDEVDTGKPTIDVWIVRNSDLRVEVGGSSGVAFQVCSITLLRACRYFEALLRGGFSESKRPDPGDGNEMWTVALPEEDAKAMDFLFRFMHGVAPHVTDYENIFIESSHCQYHEQQSFIEEIYPYFVLADKFDLVRLLSPWASTWHRLMSKMSLGNPRYKTDFKDIVHQPYLWVSFEGYEPQFHSIFCSHDPFNLRIKCNHKRLFIAWIMGSELQVELTAQEMVFNGVMSADSPNSLRRSDVLEPPGSGLLDRIEAARLEIIVQLLKKLETVIDDILKGNHGCRRMNPRKCTTSLLGVAIQSLHFRGLWPIPKAADIEYSVSELLVKLSRIRLTSETEGHRCSLRADFRLDIEDIASRTPRFVTAKVHDILFRRTQASRIRPCPSVELHEEGEPLWRSTKARMPKPQWQESEWEHQMEPDGQVQPDDSWETNLAHWDIVVDTAVGDQEW